MSIRFPATPVFRFAPSPNGLLHLGHARSALVNQQMAERAGGRLLLRIENIDVARCRPEFEEAIYRDLAWLGLQWEKPVRRQSEHFSLYREALDRLIADGLAYPAFLARSDIKAHAAKSAAAGNPWPVDPDGTPLYPPAERHMSTEERQARLRNGERHAWRLDIEHALARTGGLTWTELDANGNRTHISANPSRWGDIILSRSDAPSSYHLSVTIDDALQGVTHVVRGADLYHATSVHRLLQSLLGLPEPVYHHHGLILGADGRKLSKSSGDTGIAAFREKGITAAEVRRLAL